MQRVEQITFSGARAARLGQPVLYVTERCVLQLTLGADGAPGLKLIEVAPGVDLERDVLARMSFRPVMDEVTEMDPRLFRLTPMGLKRDLLHLDLAERIALDPESGILFINFEKMRVRTPEDVGRIKARVEEVCRPLGELVDVVVNYDGARIDEEIEPEYTAMVLDLEKRFYRVVTRFSGSAFMRMKLGRAFARSVAPHIFETREEARRFLIR